MNDPSFKPAREYHYASPAMYLSVCGADTRTRSDVGLTTLPRLVRCEECRRLAGERRRHGRFGRLWGRVKA